MGAIQLRPHYSFLPSMIAEMTALVTQLENASVGSASGLTKALYQRHHEGTLQKRVLELEQRTGVGLVLKGEANLDRVTDSQYAIVVSGSGSTRTMQSGHNLKLGGRGLAYDISAGVALATNVAWSRVGDVVTFTAGDPSVTFGAGDILYDTTVPCEMGPPGDLWIPQGFPLVWAGGLRSLSIATAGFARLRFAAGPTANTPRLNVPWAKIKCGTMTADGSGGYWGFGTYSSSSDELHQSAFEDVAGVFNRSLMFGAVLTPTTAPISVTGDPSGQTNIGISVVTGSSAAAKAVYAGTLDGSGLTPGALSVNAAVADTTLNLGSDGPPNELGISCKGGTGAYDVTLEELMWVHR